MPPPQVLAQTIVKVGSGPSTFFTVKRAPNSLGILGPSTFESMTTPLTWEKMDIFSCLVTFWEIFLNFSPKYTAKIRLSYKKNSMSIHITQTNARQETKHFLLKRQRTKNSLFQKNGI